MLYPLKLNAVFKDYIWGGRRLVSEFGKQCDYPRVAESWELCCHRDGESSIANGIFAGYTLTGYIHECSKNKLDVLGTHGKYFKEFPILIKLIDAKEFLSVQVHPDEEAAAIHLGASAKTEMWYIIDCDADAYLYYGLKNTVSKNELKKRILNHSILEVCQKVSVKKGDILFIEAGTIHAIGKGILIAEIQQNSNTTYRLYDYDREDEDHKKRPLHINRAIEAARLMPPVRNAKPLCARTVHPGYRKTLLAKCSFFTVSLYEIETEIKLFAGSESFHSLLVLEGSLKIRRQDFDLELHKGDSVFIPSSMGDYELTGTAEILLSEV